MTPSRNHITLSISSITRWMAFVIIMLFALPSLAQDKRPVNNKGKIKQMKAKSVKKKEKGSTKDIAGKRLRTKNTNSVAGRAVYSNPSPYANERRGKDRVAKPIGGQSPRIRSRSGESARTNVYPQRGPYVNHSSKRVTQSRFTRSSPKSRSTSGESSRSNVYPQKGPYVNSSTKQSERSASRTKTRTGRISTGSARITKTYSRSPRSASQSAETSKSRRFGQGGANVNQSSRSTENLSKGSNRFTRKTKLSAGPVRPGSRKKTTITPRSASQQFVTKKKKDVYWGKFSKGERAITTDIAGKTLRRKNYRTPPNEIIKPKDPYANRKKSKGDRAYSGTFKSGHLSGSKKTERAWIGDVSGQPIRKRPSKGTEVAGKRPEKAGGGSISASGEYRSNKPFKGRSGALSISGQSRNYSHRPLGGGSVSGSAKYRSNQPIKGTAGSISASGKFRSNKPLRGRSGTMSVSGQLRDNSFRPQGGGSVSASGKYRSNKPIRGAGSISASAKYRSNKPLNPRSRSLSMSGQLRDNSFKPNGGGSISASPSYRSNKPLNRVAGSISASAKYQSNKPFRGRGKPLSVSGQNRDYDFKPKGGGSVSGKLWNNDGRPIEVKTPKGSAGAVAVFQGNAKTREPKKGGGSVSGKLWNNDGRPIEVRTPKGQRAAEVGDMQVLVKAKQTGTKPKAVKGSMPGLAPTQATVKASEYSRGMKSYWNYKHNPMSVKEALKVKDPGRAYARITDYQGNVKMKKYNDKRLLPDSRFAHNKQNNVKQERTIKTDFQLLWAKIFKKNGTQPDAVKEKTLRPRYDKRERELWPGLYD